MPPSLPRNADRKNRRRGNVSSRPSPQTDASSFAIAAIVVVLALWVSAQILDRTGGVAVAPLDDAYIHFQFARSFADLTPLAYGPGTPPSGGATSLLWPALLAPVVALGVSGSRLVWVAWAFGWISLAALAWEVRLVAKSWLQGGALWGAVAALALFPGHVWFAASAMEVVPLAWLLVRAVRRAAEWAEAAPTSRRHLAELYALAVAGPLLRPEGALASVVVAAALFVRARGAGRALALLPLCCVGVPPLFYWLVTGDPTSTTALAKWLPLHPFYDSSGIVQRIGEQVSSLFLVLFDGREHAAAFLPLHAGPVLWLAMPAILLATRRCGQSLRGLLLVVVGLGIVLPATYETFVWNRLRYLWPFFSIWILGSAALFDLLGRMAAKIHWRLRVLTPILVAAMVVSFAWKLPVIVADVAVSAAAIQRQQVALGQWAREALPRDAFIGVNDAGAIAYFSQRPIFDIVGLMTPSETRHWLAGAGSRMEHYEHLGKGRLPSHFIVYPHWMGIPQLLGQRLTERTVRGATILGGRTMTAYVADYTLLGSGAMPVVLPPGEEIDRLDVSDLVSEREHDYALLGARPQDNVVTTSPSGKMMDGGRRRRSTDRFQLLVEGGGTLLMRVSAEQPVRLSLRVDGRLLGEHLVAEPWAEVSWKLPADTPRRKARVQVSASDGRFASFHYWSFGSLA